MEHEGRRVTRAQFEGNFVRKLRDRGFLTDIRPLLRPDFVWDPDKAGPAVLDQLIARLPGEPWREAND